MCQQRPQDLKDNLGNRLQSVEFVDEHNDTCDYLDTSDQESYLCTNNNFSLLQLNVRGLINKQQDLLKLVNEIAGNQKIDVITLQETWVTQTNYSQINIPGYKHLLQH